MTWSSVSSPEGRVTLPVLAGVAVLAAEYFFARQSARLVRDPTMLRRPEYGRHAQRDASGVQKVSGVISVMATPSAPARSPERRAGTLDQLVRRSPHQHRLMQCMLHRRPDACREQSIDAEGATACCRRSSAITMTSSLPVTADYTLCTPFFRNVHFRNIIRQVCPTTGSVRSC